MKLKVKRILFLCISILLFVAAVWLYGNYSPTDNNMWFPQCPFKLLTGWSCPGCGVQRATHALLNGNFAEALSYNYFFVISVPYMVVVLISFGLRKLNRAERVSYLFEHKVLAMVYVYCFFVWLIIRNILEI